MHSPLWLSLILALSPLAGETPIWSNALPWVSSAAFLDYDQDGDLDLFLGSEEVNQSQFLENTGDFTFLDATEGIGLDFSSGIRWAAPLDWDRDGATDLLVIETYDDRSLKIYQNQGGTFIPYVALPLPDALSGSPLLYDYDNNGTVDLLVPCRNGLYLLADLGTPDLHFSPLLQGIQVLSLQIFDAGRDDTLDLLLQTPSQWLLWQDFERNGPFTSLSSSASRLFPMAITPDSQMDYLEMDAAGNLRWISGSGIPSAWLGVFPVPQTSITKLIPLYPEDGNVLALALTGTGALGALRLSSYGFEWTPLLQNVHDFQIVALSKDSSPLLLVIRQDSVSLYPFTSRLFRFGPADPLSERTCLLSRFQVYQAGWTTFYRPVLTADQAFTFWWLALQPDSITAMWGTGTRVSVPIRTTPDTLFPIPLYASATPTSALAPSLLEIYPNPTTKLTQIRYQITEPSLVELTLNTLTGQQIQVIERAVKTPGTYTVTLDTHDLPPGHYLVNLRLDGETYQSKLIVLR